MATEDLKISLAAWGIGPSWSSDALRTVAGEAERPAGGAMSNEDVVRRMYAADGRGDVDAILACLAGDIAWEH